MRPEGQAGDSVGPRLRGNASRQGGGDDHGAGDDRGYSEEVGGDTGGPFLPDEYYSARLSGRAPKSGAPYSICERFQANGDLEQVTTYDAFGDRVRQFDLGDKTRHGEGFHVFEYGARYPRHSTGGGERSGHLPFSEDD